MQAYGMALDLRDDPTYRKWDELMRSMQERVLGAKPSEWWAMMQLVFDLNWPQHRPHAVVL